ncbi:MAG: hypothetical protein ACOC0P_00035 [Planctomycetota bacterium]
MRHRLVARIHASLARVAGRVTSSAAVADPPASAHPAIAAAGTVVRSTSATGAAHRGSTLAAGVAAVGVLFGAWGAVNPSAMAQSSRTFVPQLNNPINRVSDANRAYPVYFEAWSQIDSTDPQAPLGLNMPMTIGSPQLRDAMAWAGRGPQQDAIEILLEKRDGATSRREGRNATYRELFGLPYGVDYVPLDMQLSDFAVFIEDDQLYTADFAYLDKVEQLFLLAIAEGHRRAEAGEPGEGVEPLLAAVRIARQMTERAYAVENRMGVNMLRKVGDLTRAYMWEYRDGLDVSDFEVIAGEFELLRPGQVQLPWANRLIGEQLMLEVFDATTNLPDEEFADVMAEFESRDRPIRRFHAAKRWEGLLEAIDKDAGGDITRRIFLPDIGQAIEDVDQDFRRRWNLPLHDPIHSDETLFELLDPIREAVVVETFADLDGLRELRLRMIADVRGTAIAAGIAAFQKRDGGRAPRALSQVYPTFIKVEQTLVDPYNSSYEYFEYFTAQSTDRRLIGWTFDVEVGNMGTIQLPENTPILYSVGPDNRDNGAAKHSGSLERSNDSDIIYWLPVEYIMERDPMDVSFQSGASASGARGG